MCKYHTRFPQGIGHFNRLSCNHQLLHYSYIHHRPRPAAEPSYNAHYYTSFNIATFASSVLDKVGVNSMTQSGRFVNILETLFSSAD